MATKQECEETIKDFDDMTPEEQAAEIDAMKKSLAGQAVCNDKLPSWIISLAKPDPRRPAR